MRIAIVRTSLHKASGQAVHIGELALRLSRMGHRVTLFSREIERSFKDLTVTRVEFPLDGLPFIRHFGFATACGSMVKEYDVVHTQYHPGIFAGNYAQSAEGVPHVFTFHGFAPIGIWRNPLQRLKMADHRIGTLLALRFGVARVITVSQFLKEDLVHFYRIDPERVHVIYNGIDSTRFSPKADGRQIRQRYGIGDEPVILFLGRMALYKGPQYLIMAMPYVLKRLPNVKVVLAGSFRYDFPRLKELIRALGITQSVIFTGYVSDAELSNFYTSCDIFCYPSLWEGFGLPPVEAQACGKPVVAFKCCALPEVVSDGETGILVRPKDHMGLARAMVNLLTDPERGREMGIKGRERVRRLFRWDKVAAETVKVYQKAVAGD